MAHALVDASGRVCQVEADRFEVASPLRWIPVPKGLAVAAEWRWDGEAFQAPAVAAAPRDLLAELHRAVLDLVDAGAMPEDRLSAGLKADLARRRGQGG